MGILKQFKNLFNNKDIKEKEEINSYEKGLSKTRNDFMSKLNILNNKYKKITDDYFEELEEILIMADIGVNTVMSFMDRLRARVKKEKITDALDLKEIIVDEMFIIYVNDEIIVNKINYSKNTPTVILFVGVNGVGKTTTIGKMAYKLVNEGKKVLLIAGDTFRAGAVEQLIEWGNRTKTDVVYKNDADPASVIYDGLTKAKNENYDVVLIDTAGRLQNKVNLMQELAKINKVIGQLIEDAPHETLLVIDATTGQNGISQAKSFKEITNITGIVLTKLDGTAKGGIVLAIKESVNLPVKYIGLGEREKDLKVFDIEKYIYGLFKDIVGDTNEKTI
ncbi:MAG: signal recognition particle-docking protein FtsY [Bacilli bacterium]|nr:signal recognition particle-docking protein FtsY [Bacilli bacterium]